MAEKYSKAHLSQDKTLKFKFKNRKDLSYAMFNGAKASRLDFSNSNLTKANFCDATLIEANFANSNLKGAQFNNANLTGANFSGAKIGLSFSGRLTIFITTIIFSLLSAFPMAIIVTFWLYYAGIVTEKVSKLVSTCIGLAAVFVTITIRHFLNKTIENSSVTFFDPISAHVLIGTVLIMFVLVGAITDISKDNGEEKYFNSVLWTFLLLVISLLLIGVSNKIPLNFKEEVGLFGAIVGAFFGCWFSRQAISPDEKGFDWLWEVYVRFINNIGGVTCFDKAKLNDAIFKYAEINGGDFRNTEILRTSWDEVKFTEYTRFGDSYLKYRIVRKLILQGGTSSAKSFNGLNLKGISLENKILEGNEFIGTNLEGANLSNCNLKHTNFENANLNNANLSNSNLTGACIYNWNIDERTKFNDVKCEFIFKGIDRTSFGEKGRHRFPASGKFEYGEFEKIIINNRGIIELLIRDEDNKEALISAFQKLSEDKHYTFQGFDMMGNDAIVKFRLSKDSNTSNPQYTFQQEYISKKEELNKEGSTNYEFQNMAMGDFVLKLIEKLSNMNKQTIFNGNYSTFNENKGDNTHNNQNNGDNSNINDFNDFDIKCFLDEDLNKVDEYIKKILDSLDEKGFKDDEGLKKVAESLAEQVKGEKKLLDKFKSWGAEVMGRTVLSETVKKVILEANRLLGI